ncbi:MAG TPA: 23S rRNA (adenine(2503)-C(2))-methyltransferase RlmN [Polyangiaceae bacterium]
MRELPNHVAAQSGAFGLDLRELAELGLGAATFSSLHRPWTWSESGPRLGREKARKLGAHSFAPSRIVSRASSADGSVKLALETGGSLVEAVHMPRAVRGGRVTLCISSQVGCGMGCGFCATARMGFVRQLSAGEIVGQVLASLHALGPRHPGELTLVFMGMGEPLQNSANVERAIALLCEPHGLGLSPRRITVSTSGIVPEIEALSGWVVRPLLALSLNATDDVTRGALMPVGRKHGLAELRETLLRYPFRARERVTLEYVLLRGVNDSEEDARRLAEFCVGIPHQVNLIPWNAHAGAGFEAPSDTEVGAFARAVLARRRTLLTVRRSRASDVSGACGQLATQLVRVPSLRAGAL